MAPFLSHRLHRTILCLRQPHAHKLPSGRTDWMAFPVRYRSPRVLLRSPLYSFLDCLSSRPPLSSLHQTLSSRRAKTAAGDDHSQTAFLSVAGQHCRESCFLRPIAVSSKALNPSRSLPRSPRMLRRYALGFSTVGRQFSTMGSNTPVEDAIRAKLTAAFNPSTLEIYNDSHLHAHHKAMAGSTSKETHFRLIITSEAFTSKMQPARHRMIYALLREEMAVEGGIHALQLRTMTPEEEQRQRKKKKEAETAAKAETMEERYTQREAADKADKVGKQATEAAAKGGPVEA